MKLFNRAILTRMSLGKKVVIPAAVLMIAGLGASMLVSYLNSKKVIDEACVEQMTQIADSTTWLITNWVDDRKVNMASWSEQKVFKTAAEDTFLGKAARKSANEQFAKLKSDYPYMEVIALTDRGGNIVSASDTGIMKEMNVADHKYFQRAVEGKLVISEVEKSQVSGKPVFVISVPVREKNEIRGVLFCALDMTYLDNSFIGTVNADKSGCAYIYEGDGCVIAHPDKAKVLKLNVGEFDFGREMMAKGEGIITYTFEGDEMMAAYRPIKELGWTVTIGAVTSELFAPVKGVAYFNLVFGLAVTVCVAVALLGISRWSVVKPVSSAMSRLKDIADGDFTTRLDVTSEDEVGNLAREFNTFVEKLQGMIKDIGANARGLNTSSGALLALSNDMTASADEMSTQSDTVAGATEEMSANISSIATASEEMSANIQSVSSTAEQMSQNVNAVAFSIEEMSTALNDVAGGARGGSDIAGKAMQMSRGALETMNVLGKGANDIGEVTALIKRIAEQTNLLALNATIEAASAGDAGKGFAVVANEIKELANQSALAAEDIAKRIEGVQSNTEEAVKVIADISDVIDKINESSMVITKSVEQQKSTANEVSGNVHQTSSGIRDIAASISEVAKGANDMAAAAAEAAKGVVEVSSNIQGVSKASSESNTRAQHVSNSAEELAKVAGQLQQLVDRFKV
ncbi:MAG: methyl-accepting chemotaxis protein [Thermodesulfobacteriota bacterium]|nr:methyl-accepting chemotaxis protein [Thermodesulfobacteriota bacterium]